MTRLPSFLLLSATTILCGCDTLVSSRIVHADVRLPPAIAPVVPNPRAMTGQLQFGASVASHTSFSSFGFLEDSIAESMHATVPMLLGGGFSLSPLGWLHMSGSFDNSGIDGNGGVSLRTHQITVLLHSGLGLHYMRSNLIVRQIWRNDDGRTSIGHDTFSNDAPCFTTHTGLTIAVLDSGPVRPFVAVAWQVNPKIQTNGPYDLFDDDPTPSKHIDYSMVDVGAQIKIRPHCFLEAEVGKVFAYRDLHASWWRGGVSLLFDTDLPLNKPVSNKL